jgi:uncharacterized protein (TIGR02271 family)
MSGEQSTETIPLTDEELRIDKVGVITGKVRISTAVARTEEIVRASLAEEIVDVTRVPIGREVSVAPAMRTEGELLIYPVVEEILVVEKRLVLREELHLRRRVIQQNVEVPVTLRKERAVVERVAVDGHTPTSTKDEENKV